MTVRTSWQSTVKVLEGRHTQDNRPSNYKTTLLCRGEFYWFFERVDNQEWIFCPLYSFKHEQGVEHLKLLMTLEEMAL